MSVRAVFLTLVLLFLGLVLEHLVLPDLLSWLQVPWLLLIITALVLHAPQRFGLWLSIPFGLLLDAENYQLLGLNTFTLAIHIVLLQLAYRRLVMGVWILPVLAVPLLVLVHQLVANLAIWLVKGPTPVVVWQPVIASFLLWPWMNYLIQQATLRLNLR